MNSFKYLNSVLGGTFDNFHIGHKHFIDVAFESSANVTIGITSDKFLENKLLKSAIEKYEIRKANLQNYLSKKGYLKKAKIIKLENIYGKLLVEKNIDAIFVTNETFNNAVKINEKRKEIGFPQLEIVKVREIVGDDGKVISSSRIRSGEIDTGGHSYLKIFQKTKTLFLKEEFREDFKKPIGNIITGENEIVKITKNKFVIAVGDIVVYTLIKNNQMPDICIFDFKTKRQKITDKNVLKSLPKYDLSIKNLHGTINCGSVIQIQNAIKKSIKAHEKIAINVIGEEDLLALPVILLSPLDSVVLYGIRGKGAVIVTVTKDLKENIEREYLNKFIYSNR